MRPRINLFGKITRKELEEYFMENQVYGFTVTRKNTYLVYSYNMMFRSNKKDPVMIYVKVSSTSKLVLDAWTSTFKKFNNVEELKKYTKR